MNPFENFEVVTYDATKLMRFTWSTRIYSCSGEDASTIREQREQMFKKIVSALVDAEDINITYSSVEEVTFTAMVEVPDRGQ